MATPLMATAAAVTATAPDAMAQTAEASSRAPETLDAISVSATRSPISVMSYPGMVSVVDRSEIDLKDPDTLDDMLRSVPGVFFDGGPRRTGQVPTIRGFDGENVQIRIDGARQDFVSGHSGRVFVDPALLGGAEVLRGPASSLYGSGALGGMISLRTLRADDLVKPGETAAARVKFGYQDVNQEFTESLVVGGKPADGIGLVAGVVKRDSSDIELGNGESLTSDDDILSGLARIDAEITPDLALSFSYLGFANDATEPENGQGANNASDSTIVDKEIRSHTVRAQALYAPLGQDWIDFDGTVYYTDGRVDTTDPETGDENKRDVDTYGIFADNRSRFDLSDRSMLTLTYGLEASRDVQDGYDSTATDGSRAGAPDAEANFFGAFLQGETEIAEFLPGTLRVIPGIRFDAFNTDSDIDDANSDQEISPKVGVSYEPIPGLVGFASYGRAFRAPSFNELYNEGTHFAIPLSNGQTAVNSFVPNPDLEPEVSTTFEIGAGFSRNDVFVKDDAFRVKGAYFRSDVENLIDIEVNSTGPSLGCFVPTAGDCNAGTTETVNIPNAELEGYEIEGSYDARRFYITAGFSSIDGENKDTGEALGVLTPNRLSTDVGLRIHEIDTTVGVEGEFVSRFDNVDDASEERDGYAVFDVYAQWAPGDGVLKGVTFNLGVDNLFDKDYERVFAGVSEPGRNIKGSIAYRIAF